MQRREERISLGIKEVISNLMERVMNRVLISDPSKVSKEKIFKLMAMHPAKVDFAFYALVYNPYGKKKITIGHFQNVGLTCKKILLC